MTNSMQEQVGSQEGRRARLQHLAVTAASRTGTKMMLLAAPGGYLRQTGWIRSARARRPVDAQGDPQPWLTMPAIAFLDERLRRVSTLFEYGSGGSTAWFCERVPHVTSVEHHRAWYEEVRHRLPAAADLHLIATDAPGRFLDLVFRPLGTPTEYADAIGQLASEPPDVVVVDGIDRLNCIAATLMIAAPHTTLIVDNLEYAAEFAPALVLLEQHGYRRLDLWGVSPGELRTSCTSVVYRAGNCLGI